MSTINRAADEWAAAQSTATELVAGLTVGDAISYDQTEEMGEQVFAELRRALPADIQLVDEGDGHEVRISDSLRADLVSAVEAADLTNPEIVCDWVLAATAGESDPRSAAMAELADAVAND